MLVINKQNSELLQENATTLHNSVDMLLKSSNEQADKLKLASETISTVTEHIRDNMTMVNNMLSHANEVTQYAKVGEELANQTTKAMIEINEKVVAINDAVEVVDLIAFQTNILSLNAAVEAATAGEFGKSFAVVAGEVRNLANRSATSAKEIKHLVESATEQADNGKNVSNDMIHGYTKLNASIQQTISLIDSVAKASKEQQVQIEDINEAITHIEEQTDHNVSIVNNASEIALKTNDIAIEIVEDLNTKQFHGQ
jgi:methyl-accepting chemotaxis protein